jgi:hypothetical protein
MCAALAKRVLGTPHLVRNLYPKSCVFSFASMQDSYMGFCNNRSHNGVSTTSLYIGSTEQVYLQCRAPKLYHCRKCSTLAAKRKEEAQKVLFHILPCQMATSSFAHLIVPWSYHSLLVISLPVCISFLLPSIPSNIMGHQYPRQNFALHG